MFTGSIVALATPMARDGALDLTGFATLLDRHLTHGTDGVVIGGTTGESPTLSPDELVAIHEDSLRRVTGRFERGEVVHAIASQTAAASPVYDLGFGWRMPPFTGWAKGIGLAGMAQVYPLDRNMNHCVEAAERADLGALLAPL